METNSRPEATASPVKQGQYSPRKRKDTTPKVNPQLAVDAACGRTGISRIETCRSLYKAHRKGYGKRQPT